ncbi:MAG: FAD-containing monooxygenase EthA [Gammaproteobacteria bacterium]|nr:MAG: FAD-containing monooxygenase EthA [Gammaproteobacteria bacterium]RLA34992.1 MAG: FAD-containing monooxygenase EthA [Gammaproteobacteria bacterium]
MNTEYFDVVIVGAGLSGIGAAYHLQDMCPGKSYVILEGRASMGGTWDIFRYPGIRSDSDMYTLGYNFKPWLESKAIADGPSILNYIRETAAENEIEENIRYGHQVKRATWSSDDAAWTIEAQCKEKGDSAVIRCNTILMCSGYYSYESGHTPAFRGRERFGGEIIHPQQWPENIDYRDKKVVVIGSGATAVTLIPELADEARHVVMLQRSPTYMVSAPDEDWIANFLRKILPQKTAYAITRWKNIRFQQMVYRRTRTAPEKVKKQLLKMLRKELRSDYDIEKHFTPSYEPWDQRLCLVPNSDFFEAINSGKASIVTDHIDTFTEKGMLLKSGEELDADIIVTATGLDLLVLGGIELIVDGEPVDISKTFSYKAMMFSGVPNLVSTFGYINASWTLRADLTAEYFCRLLNHMDATGFSQCTPRLGDQDADMPARDWITAFSSGYMQRAMHMLPKQGDREPWLNTQNYDLDRKLIRGEAIDDGVLSFSNPQQSSMEQETGNVESNAA